MTRVYKASLIRQPTKKQTWKMNTVHEIWKCWVEMPWETGRQKSCSYLRITLYRLLCPSLLNLFLFLQCKLNMEMYFRAAEAFENTSELRLSRSHYTRVFDQNSRPRKSVTAVLPIQKTQFHSFLRAAFPYKSIRFKHQLCMRALSCVLPTPRQ